jgi:hypothetical protein
VSAAGAFMGRSGAAGVDVNGSLTMNNATINVAGGTLSLE